MPHVHDRILFLLSSLGFVGVMSASFVSHAPNRLASGFAYPLLQTPPLEGAATIAGLCGLALLSFARRHELRSFLTIAAAALLLWGSLMGAGALAAILMKGGPPAARVSLGPAFWVLASVALLAIADAFEKGRFGMLARLAMGAVLCAGFLLMCAAGDFDNLSIVREFSNNRAVFLHELLRHLWLVFAAMVLALIVGMPLAALALYKRASAGLVFGSLGVLQTIPSIALFGILISPMSKLSEEFPLLRGLGINGTGPAPAIVALTLYSLLPLVRGIHTGLTEVAADVKDAATAIGFGTGRRVLEIDLPLALPAVISGLRVVAVQAIGLASVAALIGAGGLGTFIFRGIGQYALDLVLLGAIPVILLALLANLIFDLLLGLARRGP